MDLWSLKVTEIQRFHHVPFLRHFQVNLEHPDLQIFPSKGNESLLVTSSSNLVNCGRQETKEEKKFLHPFRKKN